MLPQVVLQLGHQNFLPTTSSTRPRSLTTTAPNFDKISRLSLHAPHSTSAPPPSRFPIPTQATCPMAGAQSHPLVLLTPNEAGISCCGIFSLLSNFHLAQPFYSHLR